ncbi:hypothetical protein Ahu01nite_033280 [Winogradskya humida]|uniref:Uncharacterized protein n=1 Tax=Winogradskya humida TaxID=113566 RepID=A0ABQ3ZNR7_9ACTN|nr:hypothetical protein Ahu01nite_033280 [Actinoplanes humidus]
MDAETEADADRDAEAVIAGATEGEAAGRADGLWWRGRSEADAYVSDPATVTASAAATKAAGAMIRRRLVGRLCCMTGLPSKTATSLGVRVPAAQGH